jgi:hypothetical protein
VKNKQNPPQSPFKKGGRFEVSPLKKGEANILPFFTRHTSGGCKGELEGISYTGLVQLVFYFYEITLIN